MADARGVSCSSDAELKSNVVQLTVGGMKLTPTSRKALKFIKERGSSSHGAWDFSEASGVRFDEHGDYSRLRAAPDSDKEVEKLDFNELYQECKEAQAQLVSTQKRLLKDHKTAKELGTVMDINADEIHYEGPPQDLGNVVENACGTINQKLSTAKPEAEGKFRKIAQKLRQGLRGFCRNADNIEPFLEFIPEASGCGSVMFGALTIVIKVAVAYRSLDDLVCNALSNIRSIADSPTNLVLGAMRNNENLHKQMSGLYTCIFNVLRLVSKRVFVTRLKKFGRAITHSKTDQNELNNLRLDMLKKHEILDRSLIIVKVDRIDKPADTLSRSELEKIVNRLRLGKELHDTLIAVLEESKSLNSKTPACLSLHATNYTRVTQKERRKKLGTGLSSKEPPRVIVDDLLVSKLFPTTMVEDDCLELSSSESLSDRRDHHRVKAVTGNNQLQAFITLENEKILMIMGGMGGRDDQLSPVSHAVAKLVTALRVVQQRNQFMLTVTFFCGQHQYDGYSSCRDMMITLILQLIDQYRDFSNEILNECMQSLEARDVTGLCDLYEALCFELPETAILYCTIDGLSFFGYPNTRLSETRMIIGRLLDLSRDIEKSPKACIKFLCATPALYPDMADLFELWETLDLDACIENSEQDLIDLEETDFTSMSLY
ncbi:uncharacterized protein PG998_006693 [Apiospora kogelbergensis]|uniref:uncharacterized protein n=1 Tax=Apiospora kogelbergensis TaxID=1337665 RepID=UPI00312D212F